jgi:DNA-binding NtrC family response regulator
MNFRSTVHTGNEGIFWLTEVRKHRPDVAVVMITAYGDVPLAVQAIKQGAADFVTKPWDNDQLLGIVRQYLPTSQVETTPKLPTLLGNSLEMSQLREAIERVAPTDASVLLMGENGTGKDVVARLLHARSRRVGGPLVTLDMGAIPETLLESELFGHKKGAFTDAREDKPGKFELAHQGTLFLDEIGNMPVAAQAKLLAVLQSRQVVRIGTNAARDVDVRIVSATNADLPQMIGSGRFRQDLLFRLNTVVIRIPPLRERIGDAGLLAAHFLEAYANRYQKPIQTLSAEAFAAMERYPWPGNVRELQHCMERAVIFSDAAVLDVADVLPSLDWSPAQPSIRPETLEEVEQKQVREALHRHQGNVSRAAAELGLSRAALYRRMEKYNLV